MTLPAHHISPSRRFLSESWKRAAEETLKLQPGVDTKNYVTLSYLESQTGKPKVATHLRLVDATLKQPTSTRFLPKKDPRYGFRSSLIEFVEEAVFSSGVKVVCERLEGVPHFMVKFESRTKPVRNEGRCVLIQENAEDIVHKHSFAVVIEENKQEKTVTATIYGHPAFKGDVLSSTEDYLASIDLQESAELMKLSPGFRAREIIKQFISLISEQFRRFPDRIGEIEARSGGGINNDLTIKCLARTDPHNPLALAGLDQ